MGNLGRLGNQMFQYSALRGISSKFGYSYCLPPESYVGTIDKNCANSDCNIFQCFTLPEVDRLITSNFLKVEENSFNLDNVIWNNCPDNIDLFGYFQTEKYFKHIEDEIKKDFTFIDNIVSPCKEFMKSEFGNSDVISLHIRRGDYLNYSHHPTQSLEYYETSLNFFDSDCPVIIFSDDIEWCKSKHLFNSDRFFYSEKNSTAIDLCLQTLCTYHIIANSSFSWWGAWLANSKRVVAPKKWFGSPLMHDTKDLYCVNWVIL